ncbi:MAG: transglycosylase domain-containing protein [Bacillota bacterium]
MYMKFPFLKIKPKTTPEEEPPRWRKNVCLAAAILISLFLFYLFILFLLPLPRPVIPISSDVYDIHGKKISTLCLENRKPVPLSSLPRHLIQAFLAVEDTRFFQHNGLDLRAIIRALWVDILHQSPQQGGSTITQQLARNLYLNRRRTLGRKIQEAVLALKLEKAYTKEQILELYLNQVYFGHGAYGVEAAAETFFCKPASNLTLAESALLAGLVKGPSHYSPFADPRRALDRRRLVLRKMAEKRFISSTEMRWADANPLRLKKNERRLFAPYFLDYIVKQISLRLKNGKTLVYNGGLRIYTTLDPAWQAAAEDAVRSRVPSVFMDEHGVVQPQAALVAMDPCTGYVKALVGGRNFASSGYNRAILANRQPGSAFKPLVYAVALEKGYNLASTLSCEETFFNIGKYRYHPVDNGSSPYHHQILTLRQALVASCNVCAVKLIEKVSPQKVVDLARASGIKSRLSANLSLALGTSEVTPLELTAAYAAFANGGYFIPPEAILKITTSQNETIWRTKPVKRRIFSASTAYLLSDCLKGVFTPGGTASAIGHLPFPAAGKTGTTQHNRDAWFIGFTPSMVAGVYIGNDRPSSGLGGSGGKLAAPVWEYFALRIMEKEVYKDFQRPPDVAALDICKETHLLATPGCPSYKELFTAGKYAGQYCRVHQPFELQICTVTRLLPGPHCRVATELFTMDTIPKETCKVCRPATNILEWLRRLFRGRIKIKKRQTPF